MDENTFIERTLEEARKCTPEDGRAHPKVGAAVVRNGELLAAAYRGELSDGEHAEFTLLEKKLADDSLAGCTLYATLEPCTSRNHPKVPCVQRLIDRKVARVVIGMLDPNPIIRGRGQLALRSAGIATEFYPEKYMSQVEEMNREFIRFQREYGEIPRVTEDFVSANSKRSLDSWYETINRIYWNRNYQRDAASLFAHLVEVIGGLSLLASEKRKKGVDPDKYIAKAIAWWLVLCGKLGIKSVEEMLWDKFPSVCPYCQQSPHNNDVCKEQKALHTGPPWEKLTEIGLTRDKPGSLVDWQIMFGTIYPIPQGELYGPVFARLSEELGELAESVRVFPSEPGYFLSEACDVFAWLMHIQNLIEVKADVPYRSRGLRLARNFAASYPDFCLDCGGTRCSCPPILKETIGRIAHEVPLGLVTYGERGRFMTSDAASKRFGS